MRYGMKDVSAIFQFPFIAESDKKFSAEWFFNLSQTIFHSKPTDFSIWIKRNEAWLKDGWNILQLIISKLWETYHATWRMFLQNSCVGAVRYARTWLMKRFPAVRGKYIRFSIPNSRMRSCLWWYALFRRAGRGPPLWGQEAWPELWQLEGRPTF